MTAASIWRSPLWWSSWHQWPCAIWQTWCHHMVITQKHDGSLSHCWSLTAQQAWSTGDLCYGVSLWSCRMHQTVTDALNSYHSVPLCPSDHPWPLLSWCLAASSTQEHHIKVPLIRRQLQLLLSMLFYQPLSIRRLCWWCHTLWLWPGTALLENIQLAHTHRSGRYCNKLYGYGGSGF